MEFTHSFTVDAPLAVVSAFHRDTDVLKQLTPFPIIAQIHQFEPMDEGSNAHFTLWFGPVPLRWHAVHSNVGPWGFTDTQVNGPLRSWRHTHCFTAIDPEITRVDDHIIFDHEAGLKGVVTRLLFARPGLLYLFTARKWLTRRGVARLVDSRTSRQVIP